jgi:hypothetical protein
MADHTWRLEVEENCDVVDMEFGGEFKFWLSVKNAKEMRDALTDAINFCENNRRRNRNDFLN